MDSGVYRTLCNSVISLPGNGAVYVKRLIVVSVGTIKENTRRTPDYRQREPGVESCAVLSNYGQVRSVFIAPGHSAVPMSTWLLTVADICTNNVRALIAAYRMVFREVTILDD